MNKKLILIVISIASIIGFFVLVREIQILQARVDAFQDQVESIKFEKDELLNKYDRYKTIYEDDINELLEEIESFKKLEDESLERATEMEAKIAELTEVSSRLSTPDEATKYMLEYMGIEDDHMITEDLYDKGEKIIGYKGILGGTMHFTEIRLLNYKWVHGRFEDGHYGGYGIYEYKINENEIEWTVIAEFTDN